MQGAVKVSAFGTQPGRPAVGAQRVGRSSQNHLEQDTETDDGTEFRNMSKGRR
jgi:hypothetical protein